jgi:hypothetical protein
MSTSPHPKQVSPGRHGPLAEAIVALAETPDHASGIEQRLATIAALAADRVAAADYASITMLHGREFTTVAAGSDIALAVEEQFADHAGPGPHAQKTGEPVEVPGIAATMEWPGFHADAPALGLAASTSVLLYNGRGTMIAVLDLYGRDDAAMEPLIAGMAELYAADRELDRDAGDPPVSDPGAEELLAGCAGALSVRATIRLAVDILGGNTDDGYTKLCARAAANGKSLSAAAAGVLKRYL